MRGIPGKLPCLNEGHKPVSLLDLLNRARAAAERAGHYLREVQRPASPAGWTLKGSRDFVTEVDQKAEQIIAEALQGGTPAGQIVGEELSPDLAIDGLVWVVDPLDGTTNFLHGYPSYAVSIAAAVDGVLEAGVVHHVPHGETYFASRGGGAWLGDRRLKVSVIDDPEFALIGTGFPFRDLSRLDEYQRQFGRVAAATSGIRRAGAAALDLADVAAGRFDGFWEQRLSAWDIAAGSLLIREAGGAITDFTGRDIGVEHTGIVAGNPRIHQWLLAILHASVV
jgi:myo-inositol-1(or 4)-monophosphatase